MAKRVFLFPGQGAQSVGMCKDVLDKSDFAKSRFDTASEILGYDLKEICLNGPEEKLNTTAVSQPALYVAGFCALDQLVDDSPEVLESVDAAAGLSLGEYTALAFAGAMSFEDGLRVVQTRGQAMQESSDKTASGMTSVLGMDADKLQAVVDECTSIGTIRIANFLCPGNLVVSGEIAAIEALETKASEAGAMKCIRLSVAGAFHTDIMKPADEKLKAALESVELKKPNIPVLSNVDAQFHDDPEEIRKILIEQVLQPVLWEKSMRFFLDNGFDEFYELGPGRVLAGLMKRIQRKSDFKNVTV